MPTGYTATLLEKKQSFPQFALSCARNFGALIMMRDDPMDAEIPEKFEPSDYHSKRITEATAELARLKAMSSEERIAFGEAQKAKEIKSNLDWIKKDNEQNAKLEAMEREVLAWTPPTSDHTGMKEFMLQQLEVSKGDVTYAQKAMENAKAADPMTFYLSAVSGAMRDIEYNTEQNAKEIERAAKRTAWVLALKASLSSSDSKPSGHSVPANA